MMISFTAMIWIAFLALIAAVVALDLGVFHRERRVITLPDSQRRIVGGDWWHISGGHYCLDKSRQ